jgi:transcriptional antiterminator RfaH
VVEALIEAADARGVLQLGSKLRSGGAVLRMAGLFAEQIAILDKLDDSGRVQVLLHILGRQVAVSTDVNHLLPLY